MLNPKVILSVDLFGLPVDYRSISSLAKQQNLHFLSDAAQAMGAKLQDKHVGGLADVTATSFFPAKPLGCYGDGGAIFCGDKDLIEVMASIRTHGQGKHKYDIVRVGLNARLDTLQAAILSVKIKHLKRELASRQRLADKYSEELNRFVTVPGIPRYSSSAWAQYTVRLQKNQRSAFQAFLKSRGIPTMVYYPTAMHLQKPYAPYGNGPNSLPVSELLCREVLSLPMHPYLSDEIFDFITTTCKEFFMSCVEH